MDPILNQQSAEFRYSSWVKMIFDLVKPKNLYVVGGRGVSKSSDIIAERMIDVIYDMPRASFAFVGKTYSDLMENILPLVRSGWERKGFLEGYHYVIDKEPPAHWPKPYVPGTVFKHTISTFNGCKIFLKSLDRPSINAGISVQHIFGDEVKYFKRARLNKALPTLRGNSILLSHSPFFMGVTFCTDMPNVPDGEDDWIMDMAKNMDKEQIKWILQTALIVNDIQIELIAAQQKGASEAKISNIEHKLEIWNKRLRKIRYNSTLHYTVSTFANIDILTLDYINTQRATMEFDEFAQSILSIRRQLKQSLRFYFNLSDKNFYYDGYSSLQSCLRLKHLNLLQPLEIGFDAGNMMSLVVAQEQEQGKILRFLKCFYTLTINEEWVPHLAAKFIDFFADHEFKKVIFHYDRAANQYGKIKEDFATKLKQNLEWKDNKPTGWHVEMMSVGARNVEHEQEYNLANTMLEGKNPDLPMIVMDANECKELKSSLEIAPMRKLNGRIKKVKKSEDLPQARLPMESTNFSDAFKAVVCQRKYLQRLKGKVIVAGDPKVR